MRLGFWRLLDIEMPNYDSFSKKEKITIIRQMINRIEVYNSKRYNAIADITTNVDNFIYSIHINTYNGKCFMKTKISSNPN